MSLRIYVRKLLRAYTLLPHTPDRMRPPDRILAARLYHKQIPLECIQSAFLLAIVRRIYRPEDAPSLHTIRSLHYFLPIIEELLEEHRPLHPAYIQYLQEKLYRAGIPLADLKEIGPDPSPSPQQNGGMTR